MTIGRRSALAVLPGMVLAAMILVGCGLVPPAREPADAAASRQDFDAYLHGYGQQFDVRPPPFDAADWHEAVHDFPTKTARVSQAVFGMVTCFDPSKNCANRGLVRPGQELPIWLITFTDGTATCPEWATVDATTGAFINGQGPPC